MAKINVTTHYPYSPDFEWQTEMVDIDLDAERIHDVTHGLGFIVKSPKPIKDDLKDPDGIFSTRFGASLNDEKPHQERYRCLCGHTRGRLMNTQECEQCHTQVRWVDDNFSYFGWVVLSNNYWIIHPSLYMDLLKFIGKDTFLNIIKFNQKIDENGNVVEVQKPVKNEPFFGIGMMEFHDRFDEIIEYYHKKQKTQSKQDYYEVIVNNKDKIFAHSIPVYTTLLRPYRVENGELHYEKTNAIYKIMVSIAQKINADSNKMENSRIVKAAYLFDLQMKYMELFDEINKILSRKKGQIRQLFGGRFNFTARSVIIPSNKLNIDEVKLSYSCLCGLLQQVIINILNKSYGMSYNEAYEYLDEHREHEDPIIVGIIQGLIDSKKREGKRGLPLIINRNPTISFGGIVGVYCVGISKGFTMEISLQILKGLAADFDGDTLNILLLINEAFTEMVMATFNPRNNFMISKNDGLFDKAVNHQRDTLINANTMLNLSRPKYSKKQLEKIKALQQVA